MKNKLLKIIVISKKNNSNINLSIKMNKNICGNTINT